MDDNVPQEEKERRRKEIMDAQEIIGISLLQKEIGTVQKVLIERVDPLTQMYIGRSAKMAPDNVDGNVRFHPLKDHQPGEFATVKITKVSGANLIGDEVA